MPGGEPYIEINDVGLYTPDHVSNPPEHLGEIKIFCPQRQNSPDSYILHPYSFLKISAL